MRSILFLALAACEYDATADVPADAPEVAESCTPWRSHEIATCDETNSFTIGLAVGEFPPVVEKCGKVPDGTYECFTSDGSGWSKMLRYVDEPGGADIAAAIITCDAGDFVWSVTRHGCS